MSAVPNAPKNVQSPTIKSITKKSGLVRCGAKLAKLSLQPIHPVVRVVIRQQPRTTTGLKSTENPDILISQIHIPTVPHVIQVSVGVDTSVSNVARLKQNKKVLSAIIALTNVIEKVLSTGKNTGSGRETPITNTGKRLGNRLSEVKHDPR